MKVQKLKETTFWESYQLYDLDALTPYPQEQTSIDPQGPLILSIPHSIITKN